MTTIGTDKIQIRELLASYEKALNTSDASAAAAVYAEDGVFYPYNLPTATGTEQLLASYEQIFNTIKLDIAFDVYEIVVEGDLAYATTGSKGQVTVLEPNLTVAEENREVFVFVRLDGAWKIARYMFNKPAAPATPEA
ncbi:YybH family protein [Saccharopolyspora shandongensis]|uniref:YybH family protein n=1 Tax=Saccharopolyspora shandongensis TaxID=418495 RepID=UPI00341056FA